MWISTSTVQQIYMCRYVNVTWYCCAKCHFVIHTQLYWRAQVLECVYVCASSVYANVFHCRILSCCYVSTQHFRSVFGDELFMIYIPFVVPAFPQLFRQWCFTNLKKAALNLLIFCCGFFSHVGVKSDNESGDGCWGFVAENSMHLVWLATGNMYFGCIAFWSYCRRLIWDVSCVSFKRGPIMLLFGFHNCILRDVEML